jgi:Holliday junction resolvasome RuvABC endonuclease subunit
MEIVAVDPGFRNFGWARLLVNGDLKVQVVGCGVLDIGAGRHRPESIPRKLALLINKKEILHDVDLLVVENNNFGKANTQPVLVGIQHLVVGIAATRNPNVKVSFLGSMEKFRNFREIPLPNKHSRRKTAAQRRSKIKMNSICLARALLQKHNCDVKFCFNESNVQGWEHIADALGLAFAAVKLKLIDFSWTSPPPSLSLSAPGPSSCATAQPPLSFGPSEEASERPPTSSPLSQNRCSDLELASLEGGSFRSAGSS